jgi:hypothetical protein
VWSIGDFLPVPHHRWLVDDRERLAGIGTPEHCHTYLLPPQVLVLKTRALMIGVISYSNMLVIPTSIRCQTSV